MKDLILKIIDESRFYPSGDNAQPFNFKIEDQLLYIKHCENRALHAFNPHNVSSKITLGCLLEAIKISASKYNLSFNLELMNDNLDAKLIFSKNNHISPDSLSHSVHLRKTDRRPYNLNCNLQEIEQIIYSEDHLLKSSVSILENKNLASLKSYLIEADKIIWTWSRAFRDIGKTIKFDSKGIIKIGLSTQNLGLKSSEIFATKILVKFPLIYKILNKIGLMSLISKTNTLKSFNSSPAFLLVSMKSNEDLIQAGRNIYRVWTLLCANGYSLQPMSAAVLTPYCYKIGVATEFPQYFKDFYEENINTLANIFHLDKSQVPIFLFRIGKVETVMPKQMEISRIDIEDLIAA
ncbi:MAG: hypothetical protein KDD58_07860 [Bdellovibrionales bacterium]|nr:hypothetical protein [Bdellovibrionales bacterium]